MQKEKLDNQNLYKKFDTGRVAESIELLPDQMRQVLEGARLIKVPREFSKVNNVAINGMGGSNLGARIIKSVWSGEAKAPIIITPGYLVPRFIGKNTLYILSSYSGTTEETLSVYREVKKRGAKIMAITEDSPKSKLKKLMLKDNLPGFFFKPQFNPSNQPRLALGYSIFGMATLMAKAGLFSIKVKEMRNIIAEMELATRKLNPAAKLQINQAKKIALALQNKIPVIIGAEFTLGNLHTLRNQINECSKNFADYLEIPDLNHHAMEGLAFPRNNPENLAFLFFNSSLYSPRVQKRLALTKKVVEKNKIDTYEYALSGQTKIEQAFRLLQLGAWISYYLGILNEVDPVKIPWVDWFKEQLK